MLVCVASACDSGPQRPARSPAPAPASDASSGTPSASALDPDRLWQLFEAPGGVRINGLQSESEKVQFAVDGTVSSVTCSAEVGTYTLAPDNDFAFEIAAEIPRRCADMTALEVLARAESVTESTNRLAVKDAEGAVIGVFRQAIYS